MSGNSQHWLFGMPVREKIVEIWSQSFVIVRKCSLKVQGEPQSTQWNRKNPQRCSTVWLYSSIVASTIVVSWDCAGKHLDSKKMTDVTTHTYLYKMLVRQSETRFWLRIQGRGILKYLISPKINIHHLKHWVRSYRTRNVYRSLAAAFPRRLFVRAIALKAVVLTNLGVLAQISVTCQSLLSRDTRVR